MTITREQIADLRPGDVVEFTDGRWLPGTVLRGPLWAQSNGALLVGDLLVRHVNGNPGRWDNGTFTVISRAPLYVNHPRTEPVPGDVARDEGSNHALAVFIFVPEEDGGPRWLDTAGDWFSPAEMCEKRLRLLVDGETGQVVPPGE